MTTTNSSKKFLIEQLLSSFQAHQSQLLGRRVWLACSGGRDSLSLAALCHQLYQAGQLPFLPQLLHVHHGLQAANEAWAEQVQAWATSHGMPCQILRIKVTANNEQAARQARYDAMMQVMNVGDVLMLGHHSDDQAETVLMRLFHGAGVHGLGGMRVWTNKQRRDSKDNELPIYLWRPWLSVSRQQITNYAKGSSLPYVDDPSNIMAVKPLQTPESVTLATDMIQSTYLVSDNESVGRDCSINDRAWLRGVILPQIEARFPQASLAISRSSQLLQQASEIVTEQAQSDIITCLVDAETMFGLSAKALQISAELAERQSVLSVDDILGLPRARQANAIHQWLSPEQEDLPPPKRLVDEVLQLCQRQDGNHQTQHHWHSGAYSYEIRRYQDQLFRLRSEWIAWLDQPVQPQYYCKEDSCQIGESLSSIDLKGKDNRRSSDVCYHDHANQYKLGNSSIHWQLKALDELVDGLSKAADDRIISSDYACYIEPLPRKLAVTLLGRSGSKSGKKLLQALRLPAFMRETVALCSLSECPRGSQNNKDFDLMRKKGSKTPLFLMSLAGIHLLESPYADIVKSWLEHHQPVMLISHNEAH